MTKRDRLLSRQSYSEEGKLLADVMAFLEPQERDGIKAVRVCDRYNRGYSDVWICVQGQLVLAELKDDTGEASPQQIDFIESMQRCGAIGSYDCRTVADVAALVDAAKDKVRLVTAHAN